MTLILNIIALILALPLQMASFNRAIVHLSEHRHIAHAHHHAIDHDDEDDLRPSPASQGEPSDSDGGSSHSHEKELSGVLVQVGISRNEIVIELEPSYKPIRTSFELDHFQGRSTFLMVFRPPISA